MVVVGQQAVGNDGNITLGRYLLQETQQIEVVPLLDEDSLPGPHPDCRCGSGRPG